MDQILLFALFALIAIAFFVLVQVAVARRRKRLAAWAQSRGLEFAPFRNGDFPYRHSCFECFGKGHNRYADNVAQGRIGNHQLCTFDYHYTTGSGKSQSTHRFSGVVVTTNLPLKPLWIRHETVFDRIAGLVGMEHIQLESAEFNREFHVAAPDPRWAFDVLPQSTMEFLLDSPKFALEFQLCQILACRDGLFEPGGFDAAIAVIEGVLSRLPASLMQELQGVDR